MLDHRIAAEMYLTYAQMNHLNDDEILQHIKNAWGISADEPIEVIGTLTAHNNAHNKYHYRIYNVSTLDGTKVDYPLDDIDIRKSIEQNGIYTPPLFDDLTKKLAEEGLSPTVRCVLELSSDTEREKQGVPCYNTPRKTDNFS